MPVNQKIYGIEHEQERRPEEFLRDTRTPGQILADLISGDISLPSALALCAIILAFYPILALPLFLIGILIFSLGIRLIAKRSLPFRLPKYSNRIDFNDPKPGIKKSFFKASGIFFLGISNKFQELWLNSRDLLTHILILGTTGAGKTEAMLSIGMNFLAMGSGFIYIDAKGSSKLEFQVGIMLRMLGRDDDLRVLNFSTANKKGLGHSGGIRMTNTMNPVSAINAESAINMLTSLIEVSHGENAVFGQNAISMATSLMFGAVELRDLGEPFSIERIRHYMHFQNYHQLAQDPRLSRRAKESMMAFLKSVSYDESKPANRQSPQTQQQFGYARAYFNQALTSLIDVYGHIYGEYTGEIDMQDAVLQNRVVVGILPSLEKSDEEIRNVGKITLSAVRNAIAVGLGSKFEGSIGEALGTLPMRSPAPFMVAVDEYAAIPVPGFVQALTQGRSLGIATVIGSQDFAGLKRADEHEAEQIVANTKVKFAMSQSDPNSTFELVKALAGEGMVTQTAGAHIDENVGIGMTYRDKLNTEIRQIQRVRLEDLAQQTEGEFHAFYRGRIVRGHMFYADPPLKDHYGVQIHVMLCMTPYSKQELDTRYGQTKELLEKLKTRINNNEEFEADLSAIPDVWIPIINSLDEKQNGNPEHQRILVEETNFESGIRCLLRYGKSRHIANTGNGGSGQKPLSENNIPAPIPTSADIHESMREEFSILNVPMNDEIREDLVAIEEMAGSDKRDAQEKAGNIAQKLYPENEAGYPPDVMPDPDHSKPVNISNMLDDLISQHDK